jgi:serine/threonine protein kinase/TolB-like protein/tetratricopeptide (TPR) repeat protein
VSSGQLNLLRKALADRYQFERELGEGAYATVFLARDLRHERPVAIKVLHTNSSTELNEIRFLREIHFLASLQHPNIVPVHDSGHVEDLLYYVMPYVRGETVRNRIDRERRLQIKAAVSIACEVADALDYAHRQGVIHRDIKPENILLSGRHAMLADFGVARAIDSARIGRLTKTGFGSPGTPAYMSPEQILHENPVDNRTDIYSLGCVLYETLTGKAPFEGAAGFGKRFTEAPPSARGGRPDIPSALDDVLKRALGRTPVERFTTGAEMCDALSDAMKTPDAIRDPLSPVIDAPRKGEVISGGQPNKLIPLPEPPLILSPATKRRRMAILGVVGLALIIGAAQLIGLTRRSVDVVAADPRRVAVLDFEDHSPDHTLGHIASGLAVSLTQELGGVSSLQVLSRNSVKLFQDRGVSIDSLVRALRVGSLIEGSLQRSGDKLRLTVQVIDPQSKTQLESATLERGMGELFLLEDDLAHQVAVILRRRLGVVFRVHATISGTTSASARELVFRAHKLREDAEADAVSPNRSDFLNAQVRLRSADSLLSLAEKADPNWIAPTIDRGWVALSLAQSVSDESRAEIFQRAIEHANRALRREANNAGALELRGTAFYWEVMRLELPDSASDDRLTRSSADLNRALASDSSLASAWGTLSLVRFSRGDVIAADRTARTALAMDTYLKDAPRILSALYSSNLITGNFGDASKWCEEGVRDYPRDSRFLDCEVTLLAEDNRKSPDPATAWRLVRRANEIDPAARARADGRPYLPIYREMMVAMVLARVGQRDSALSIARRARDAIDNDSEVRIDFLYDDAYLHLLLGKQAESIRLLSEYLAARPSLGSLLSRHHRWQPLWNHPAFISLI